MRVPTKNETKQNIPADGGHLFRTEIDSTDFKNENLTTKLRRSKVEKNNRFQTNIFQKILQQTKPSDKIKNKYIKKYWTEK